MVRLPELLTECVRVAEAWEALFCGWCDIRNGDYQNFNLPFVSQCHTSLLKDQLVVTLFAFLSDILSPKASSVRQNLGLYDLCSLDARSYVRCRLPGDPSVDDRVRFGSEIFSIPAV